MVGAGTMGAGIATAFINAGLPATLLESTQDALDRGLAKIRSTYDSAVRRGRMGQQDVELRLSLLQPTLSYDSLRDTDLVVEAVFEDMSVKEQVFSRLDAVVRQGAILASNTSTLDLNRIAGFTKRPADVVGLHFSVRRT